jgi:hypothetical protein
MMPPKRATSRSEGQKTTGSMGAVLGLGEEFSIFSPLCATNPYEEVMDAGRRNRGISGEKAACHGRPKVIIFLFGIYENVIIISYNKNIY